MVALKQKMSKIHREITPLTENDCFLVMDRERHSFTFPIHFHPEFEINYICNAAGAKRVVGDHVGEIGERELVMVGSNVYHGWENDKNNQNVLLHEITIQFPKELFTESTLNKNILSPIKKLFKNAEQGILFSPETMRILEPKLFELSKKSGFDNFLAFQSLLYDLAISRDQKFLTNISLEAKDSFHNSKRIETVYNYIKKNFKEELRINDIAALINMPVVSFSRLIKKRTGKTFVEFVNEVRLGYATWNLIETNKSVSEICFECGFNNISNFNRAFKKRQNCTPSEFRENFNGVKNVY